MSLYLKLCIPYIFFHISLLPLQSFFSFSLSWTDKDLLTDAYASLHQILVGGVITLTSSVVAIVYIIGLPYYWNKSPVLTSFLMVLGHWLLINVAFHFYMAARTDPGTPPKVRRLEFDVDCRCKWVLLFLWFLREKVLLIVLFFFFFSLFLFLYLLSFSFLFFPFPFLSFFSLDFSFIY